jgi:ketosteroid isomerase-like protein
VSEDEVRAANAAFYAAFESLDLDEMAEVWERSDRASVTHPGWPTLRGWAKVAGSWEAIFVNTPYIQFVLTDEVVSIAGGVAWVTVDENILQAQSPLDGGELSPSDEGSEISGSLVAATNVFAHDGDRWRMVVHHGSPVHAMPAPD